jgi:type IV secretion system protein TrbL
MGYVSFFENFVQIVVLLFAWIVVLLAFFILAIQLFVTLIEFKLTTLAGFVLIPFGLFGKTAFAAERVLGNVISSGIKVLVLAVIVGIGSTLFAQFTGASNGDQPTIEGAMTLVLAALSLLGLGLFGPGIANGLVSGGPQLGAGAAAGAALAAGGVVVAGAGLAAGSAGLASSAVTSGGPAASALRGAGSGALRGSSTTGPTDGAASVASPLRQAAEAQSGEAQAASQPEGGGSSAGGAPQWAQRLKAAHTVHQGVSTTTQAVRSAEQGGQGNAVDLSEGKS